MKLSMQGLALALCLVTGLGAGAEAAGREGSIHSKSSTVSPDSLGVRAVLQVAHKSILRWDTLKTACLSLVVQPTGNMGIEGAGGVNMNFSPPLECDTGANSRGKADVYLYDGSPVILRKTEASAYIASWAIFSDGWESEHGFKPLLGFAPTEHITSNPHADIVASGTFCTVDSLVKVEKTWYAPKEMADSCKFILQKMQVFPYNEGASVSGLAIGEVIDWDVPSDSAFSADVAGQDWNGRKMIWMRGFNSTDGLPDCRDNSRRYAGMGILTMHLRNCASLSPYGGFARPSDSFVFPMGNFVPSQLWANMQVAGAFVEGRTTDLHSVLTYQNVASTGYTLPANDTLTAWTTLMTIPDAASTAAGLDSLKSQYDRALRFMRNYSRPQGWDRCVSNTCCQGSRGNVNTVGIIDLSDLALLIAYLTALPGQRPTLPCPASADVNGDGRIDLGDLSCLVLVLSGGPRLCIAPC